MTDVNSCIECKEHTPCNYRCKNPDIQQENKTTPIIYLDALVRYCGYFTGDVETNNGYGCNHPEQEDTEENSEGIMEGRCFPFSCPIASEVRPSDEPLDRAYFPDVKEEDFAGMDYDGNMVVWGMFKSRKEE